MSRVVVALALAKGATGCSSDSADYDEDVRICQDELWPEDFVVIVDGDAVDYPEGVGGSYPTECSEPESPLNAPLIAGRYNDQLGREHIIGDSTWTIGDEETLLLATVNNEYFWSSARNAESNTANACLWSRVDWRQEGETLRVCISGETSGSECVAQDVPAADSTDFDQGCEGQAWLTLRASSN